MQSSLEIFEDEERATMFQKIELRLENIMSIAGGCYFSYDTDGLFLYDWWWCHCYKGC